MIRRTPFDRTRPPAQSQRINHQIRIPRIRVIGPAGEQLGIMTPEEGRRVAESHGLDLVEVAAEARPPVCKILNFDKFRYEQAKRKNAAKADKVELKTVRLRPRTDDHDLETKLKHAIKFLAKGYKVKLEMAMRGRERAYIARWARQLDEFAASLSAHAKIVSPPKAEGRVIGCMLEPLAAPVAAVEAVAAATPAPA